VYCHDVTIIYNGTRTVVNGVQHKLFLNRVGMDVRSFTVVMVGNQPLS